MIFTSLLDDCFILYLKKIKIPIDIIITKKNPIINPIIAPIDKEFDLELFWVIEYKFEGEVTIKYY